MANLRYKAREDSNLWMVLNTLVTFRVERCMGRVDISGSKLDIGSKENTNLIFAMEKGLTSTVIPGLKKESGDLAIFKHKINHDLSFNISSPIPPLTITPSLSRSLKLVPSPNSVICNPYESATSLLLFRFLFLQLIGRHLNRYKSI